MSQRLTCDGLLLSTSPMLLSEWPKCREATKVNRRRAFANVDRFPRPTRSETSIPRQSHTLPRSTSIGSDGGRGKPGTTLIPGLAEIVLRAILISHSAAIRCGAAVEGILQRGRRRDQIVAPENSGDPSALLASGRQRVGRAGPGPKPRVPSPLSSAPLSYPSRPHGAASRALLAERGRLR